MVPAAPAGCAELLPCVVLSFAAMNRSRFVFASTACRKRIRRCGAAFNVNVWLTPWRLRHTPSVSAGPLRADDPSLPLDNHLDATLLCPLDDQLLTVNWTASWTTSRTPT